ncbi:MAG: M12 family metallo-peptidase [Bacteroidia bacterium]
MKIKQLLVFMFLIVATIAVVANNENEKLLFNKYNGSRIDASAYLANATFLELDFNVLNQILEQRNQSLTLKLPVSETDVVTLELHQSKVMSDDFVLSTDKKQSVKYIPGVYYQGTVNNQYKSIAGISLFNNNVMGVFTFNGHNYILGLWENGQNINKNIYVLFKESDIKNPTEFKCATNDALEFVKKNKSGGNPNVQSNNCIKIYFECDYQMYQDKGTVNDVTNYVTGFFNIVQQIYLTEQINTEISQIYVWTTTDPYVSNATSSDYLNDFQATRTTFNGNVAHLLTTRNLGLGGLAYLDVICDLPNAYAFSNIENTYQPYPNYSNTILIVTHELGHNFGSKHTHWCGWPGGAIDDCYATEGGCPGGASPPPNGGTIMSYCHLSIGTLLSNGFGTLPGNAIRAAYNSASCLTGCNSAPTADFSASIPSGCSLPQTINFTDESTFGTNAWAWDIDNNGTVDYTTQNPSHVYTVAGSYTVKLIATNSNGSDTIIKTNFVNVGTVPAGSSIAITSGSNAFCEGTLVTFTATPTNGGTTPTYQWYVDGSPVSGETDSTFTSNTLTGNPVVTCQITSSADCASPATATSTGITLTITPNATPQITIAIANNGDETICAGESVTFNYTTVNGGGSPTFQWAIGSTPVGTGPTFTSATLANGDLVTCTMTSTVACANPSTVTSTAISMIVNPIVTPTASIAISSGTLPACPGSNVSFAASSTEGGGNPSYQWQLNGNNTHVGSNYTPVNPSDGDVVSCILTSSANCLTTDNATSNSITITLIDPVVPGISIATSGGTNAICYGDTTTVFTATPSNGGATPSYQWLLNGFPITGADSSVYNAPTIINGDIFSCEITSSGVCPQTVESNAVTMTVTPIPSIIYVSNMDVCAGDIPETVFSSNPQGASYTWTNSNTAIGLAASGTGNVSAFTSSNTGTSSITGTVTVTPAIDGCEGDTETYTITINQTPEITVSGATLTSTSGAGYQWYLDGIPVPNANSQSYTATENGEYSVIIDGVDCPSAGVLINAAGINAINEPLLFNLYPNPSDGNFSVSFFSAEQSTYKLKMVNAVGAVVYEKTFDSVGGNIVESINLQSVANGVYLLHFSSNKIELLKKVVIQ